MPASLGRDCIQAEAGLSRHRDTARPMCKENIDLVAVLEALPEFLLNHLKES